MTAEKVKRKYLIENPNTAEAVAALLKQIVIEKLITVDISTIRNADGPNEKEGRIPK